MEMLTLVRADPEGFVAPVVTQDETGSPRDASFLSNATQIEGHEAIQEGHGDSVWDPEGILLVDFLDHGRTISGLYHLQVKLWGALLEKRRGKVTRSVLLLQGNAPGHKSTVATNKEDF